MYFLCSLLVLYQQTPAQPPFRGHFAVTGGNEAGVDLVLIQPFLLYYVNHVVLMLTSMFQA